jgi:PAS domain S-box-containing protein
VALPAASGFAGTIAAERRPRVLEGGATAELMWPVLRERLRVLAGVPLVLGEDVLGVLHVGSDAPRVFGDDDIALLEMVAARIASALDRAAAYESLRRAEERLHVALEAGRMGVWEWQAEAQRMSWSPTLEAIHGLPAGSFEGTLQAYRDRLHPEDRERVLRAMRESFEMGADFHAEYRVRRPGGDLRWLSTHGQVIADGDGRPAGLTGICRDVTEEKLLDAARETAIAELTRNAKLHEVFTGILGHDLRNPLGAILMGSHFAISQNEDQRLVKPLARILRSAERMARMIDQLLDFTRVRLGGGIPVDPRQADLLPVLRQVVEELDDAHPDAVLRFEHAGDSAGSWDPDRLAQVFSNLVGNALQHGTGHDVQVRLDGSAEEALLVEVRNAGRIPEELLPNLFEPLSGRSVKTGSPQGFGLGLFISHEIVQAHGGRLDVRSDGENGTVFQVRLPRARGRG